MLRYAFGRGAWSVGGAVLLGGFLGGMLGCGGGGDASDADPPAPPLSEEIETALAEYTRLEGQIACNWRADCCDAGGGTFPRNACALAATIQSEELWRERLRGRQIRLDHDAFDECRALRHTRTSCSRFDLADFSPCLDVFDGPRGPGEACTDDIDCASQSRHDCVDGVCVPRPGLGDACSRARCQHSNVNWCEPGNEGGAFCLRSDVAAEGTPCVQTCRRSTCERVPGPDPEGGVLRSCRQEDGLFCGNGRTCERIHALGGPCSSQLECGLDAQCLDARCQPLAHEGGACARGGCTGELHCRIPAGDDHGVCRTRLPVGSPCVRGVDACDRAWCNHEVQGHCQPFVPQRTDPLDLCEYPDPEAEADALTAALVPVFAQ